VWEIGDADGVEQANQQIDQLEKQIGAPELKRLRAQLAAADRKRLETLRDYPDTRSTPGHEQPQ